MDQRVRSCVVCVGRALARIMINHSTKKKNRLHVTYPTVDPVFPPEDDSAQDASVSICCEWLNLHKVWEIIPSIIYAKVPSPTCFRKLVPFIRVTFYITNLLAKFLDHRSVSLEWSGLTFLSYMI
jgi:hypothetical protein